MDLGKLVILLGGLVVFFSTCADQQLTSFSNGQQYVFGIPQSWGVRKITLFISSEVIATVQMEAPFIQMNLTRVVAETTLSLPLEDKLEQTKSGVSKKGVYIKSDVSISVHVLIEDSQYYYKNYGFLAKPLDAKSKEFYVFTYLQNSNANEFVISIPIDNTEIRVMFKTTYRSVTVDNTVYFDGDTLQRTLSKYDTLQIQGTGDLTGTYINSSKPISVLSGNRLMQINSGYYSTVVDQVFSIDEWQTNYVTSNLETNSASVIRIMASEDGTVLEINNSVVSTLQKGAYYEKTMTSTGIQSIKGSRPIAVVQFYDPRGSGPFMVTVPAMNQFLTSYTFEVPTGYHSNNLIVYVETNKTDGVTLDGRVIRMTDMKTINVPSLSTSFSAGRIALTEGKHKLTHTIHGTQFGALLYGLPSYGSYGYYGSYGFFLGYSNGPVCTPACLNNGACIAGNTCHCQLGYLGQRCELGTDLASELKPRLYTLVDDKGNSFMDPMAWYADPPISDTNKVCYVKILVKNSTIETLAAAVSSTTDGVEYGNFTTGPLDSTAGVTGLTRFACLEVRCPFVTLDGTPRDTVIDVSLTGNNSEACRIRDHSAHVTNFTIQSEDDKSDAFQFVLEVGKNYGPYYGVYMAIGSRDKAKFLAERKCGSGNEYDYEGYNPSAGVLAEYSC